MGRKITFNLLNGQGTAADLAHGWLSIRPTNEYKNGNYLVLATETEERVRNGVVVFPDVQPTPAADPNTGKYKWCYIITYRDNHGYKKSWYAAVPAGTGDLQGSQLVTLVPDDVHYTIMKGDKGDKGDGLRVLGAYASLTALQAAVPNPKNGDTYIVGSKVYVWDGTAWGASGDLTGAKGDKGDTGNTGFTGATGAKGEKGDTGATPEINAVANTGTPGSAVTVTQSGTAEEPVLTFTIPAGTQGATGAKGNKGDKGDVGPSGSGVPVGGAAEQVIVSNGAGSTYWSNADDLIGEATVSQTGLMSSQDKADLDTAARKIEALVGGDSVVFADIEGVQSGTSSDATSALNAAMLKASGGTLVLSPKTYRVDGTLMLPKTLRIEGRGARLVRGPGIAAPIIASGTNSSGTYGSGGNGIHIRDLKIEGNYSDSSKSEVCIYLHLTDNVLIENVVFKYGMMDSHYIDLGGCRDVIVRDSQFIGAFPNATRELIEAVQVDVATKQSSSYKTYPDGAYSGLPTTDVKVYNCLFSEVTIGGTTYPTPSAVGTHTGALTTDAGYYKNIEVSGCKFFGLMAPTSGAYAGILHFAGVDGLVIRNNTFSVGTIKNTATRAVINLRKFDAVVPEGQTSATSPTTTSYTRLSKNITISDNMFVGYGNYFASGNSSNAYGLITCDSSGTGGAVKISGNIIPEVNGVALFLSVSSNATVVLSNNSLNSKSTGVACVYSTGGNIQATSNSFSIIGTTGKVVYRQSGARAKISDNLIAGGDEGIHVASNDNGIISGNIVEGYLNSGIHVGQTSGASAFDLSVYGNRVMSTVKSGTAKALWIDTTATRTMRFGNRFRDGGVVTDSGTGTISNALDQIA